MIDRSTQPLELVEGSVLGTALLKDFVEAAGQVDANVSSLLQRVARREIERVTRFVRQLPVGNEIVYDGEDREWLLGLTQEAQRSIDAISVTTEKQTGHREDPARPDAGPGSWPGEQVRAIVGGR
jgi:hypothetical protein